MNAHETPEQTLARLAEIEALAVASEPGPWGTREKATSYVRLHRRHWLVGQDWRRLASETQQLRPERDAQEIAWATTEARLTCERDQARRERDELAEAKCVALLRAEAAEAERDRLALLLLARGRT